MPEVPRYRQYSFWLSEGCSVNVDLWGNPDSVDLDFLEEYFNLTIKSLRKSVTRPESPTVEEPKDA